MFAARNMLFARSSGFDPLSLSPTIWIDPSGAADFAAATTDLSGAGNHFNNSAGTPELSVDAVNGLKAIRTKSSPDSGRVWITNSLQDPAYSIATVGRRIAGTNGRLVSSKNINWLVGFWSGKDSAWYLDGGPYDRGAINNDWHLHVLTASADDKVNFWKDSVHTDVDSPQAYNSLWWPSQIQIGGFGNGSETMDAHQGELIYAPRIWSPEEIENVTAYLSAKWLALGS